jgi:hypothetical protein
VRSLLSVFLLRTAHFHRALWARCLVPALSWAVNLLVRCWQRVQHYSVTDFAGARGEVYVPTVTVLKEI